ncbi:MAG TPA: phospholipase D-like domain-containing protein [Nocardioides sp.]|nr:phospholipase D-like domain-containing protein [Nocardioides sp.]
MSTLGARLALVVGLVAGLLVLPVSADAGTGQRIQHYVPPSGPSFNNPIGTPQQQRKLLQQVIRTVNSTPPGSTIRMAVFSFGDGPTADALIAAHQRGVHVKMVFAGENVYPAMARLRTALGTDADAPSFVRICQNSCRGVQGQMHAKYFSFSRAGSARWITMVGSVNLTEHNAQDQWNDLYTRVDDRPYFRAYGRWFGQLKNDEPVTKQYLHKSVDGADIRITPVDLTAETDPILLALDDVQCVVTVDDREVRTGVYISTHAWNEERGKAIAWKVAGLRGEGCDVKVFYGTGMGAAVKSILKNHGVRMRKGKHAGIRTHQKVMIVSGGYAGEPSTVRAWTGSQNWSTRATRRDDLIVRVDDQAEAAAYEKRFLWMWDHG